MAVAKLEMHEGDDFERELTDALRPDGAAEHAEGYSIREKAGDNLAEAMRLADWHLRRVAEIRREIEAKRELVRRQIEELKLFLQREEERAANDERWHLEVLRQFMKDYPPARGRTHRLPSGTVALRKTRMRTQIVDEAVLAYAEQHEDAYGTLVEIRYVVNKEAVRRRFRVDEAGNVIDTQTGEIVGPVKHYTADGREVESPLIVITEPPGEEVVVKTFEEVTDDGD